MDRIAIPLALGKRGFLPAQNTPIELPAEYLELNDLSHQIPERFGTAHLRPYLKRFPLLDNSRLRGMQLVRAAQIYFFAGSAFVSNHHHSKTEQPEPVIPAGIAIPMVQLAKNLGIPPILNYFLYSMANFRFLDQPDQFDTDNLHVIQEFWKDDTEENWFIVGHVPVEAKAAAACVIPFEIKRFILEGDVETITELLKMMFQHSLEPMHRMLKRISEHTSPDSYHYKIRPQIMSFTDVIYEGVEEFHGQPQSFRGQTGAETPCIRFIQEALGVHYADNQLLVHLQALFPHMLPQQRGLIKYVGMGPSIRQFVLLNRHHRRLRAAYNLCIYWLWQFKELHLQYAYDYIATKTDNSTGTGGTPFLKWLGKMAADTPSFFIE